MRDLLLPRLYQGYAEIEWTPGVSEDGCEAVYAL
jgi:hypothetical protein